MSAKTPAKGGGGSESAQKKSQLNRSMPPAPRRGLFHAAFRALPPLL